MRVRLRHRFEWDCPNCHSCNPADFEVETADEDTIRSLGLVEDWQEVPDSMMVEVSAIPNYVTCRECDRKWEALPPKNWTAGPEEDDED